MKTTIYSQRIDLNNWEILGIEKYFENNFGLNDFIYSDKTINIHIDDNVFGIYKISHGDDLYLTLFNDDSENITYRLNLVNDNFYQLSENFEFVAEFDNIFNDFK